MGEWDDQICPFPEHQQDYIIVINSYIGVIVIPIIIAITIIVGIPIIKRIMVINSDMIGAYCNDFISMIIVMILSDCERSLYSHLWSIVTLQ